MEQLELNISKCKANVRPQLILSVVNSFRQESRKDPTVAANQLSWKFDKLSVRENRALRQGSHSIIFIMDGGETPNFVTEILLLKCAHYVREKIRMHFPAEVDTFCMQTTQMARSFVRFKRPQIGIKKVYAKFRRKGMKKVSDNLLAKDLMVWYRLKKAMDFA